MKQKFKKVLVLGSGALKIGQAGEFDYSGSQQVNSTIQVHRLLKLYVKKESSLFLLIQTLPPFRLRKV